MPRIEVGGVMTHCIAPIVQGEAVTLTIS